jgi:hypothetical protein
MAFLTGIERFSGEQPPIDIKQMTFLESAHKTASSYECFKSFSRLLIFGPE